MAVYVVVAKDGMPVSRSAGADSGLGAALCTSFSASSWHGVADTDGHLAMLSPGFQDFPALPGSSGASYALCSVGRWGRLLSPPAPVARPGEGALHGCANAGSPLTAALGARRNGADFTQYKPSELNCLPTAIPSRRDRQLVRKLQALNTSSTRAPPPPSQAEKRHLQHLLDNAIKPKAPDALDKMHTEDIAAADSEEVKFHTAPDTGPSFLVGNVDKTPTFDLGFATARDSSLLPVSPQPNLEPVQLCTLRDSQGDDSRRECNAHTVRQPTEAKRFTKPCLQEAKIAESTKEHRQLQADKELCTASPQGVKMLRAKPTSLEEQCQPQAKEVNGPSSFLTPPAVSTESSLHRVTVSRKLGGSRSMHDDSCSSCTLCDQTSEPCACTRNSVCRPKDVPYFVKDEKKQKEPDPLGAKIVHHDVCQDQPQVHSYLHALPHNMQHECIQHVPCTAHCVYAQPQVLNQPTAIASPAHATEPELSFSCQAAANDHLAVTPPPPDLSHSNRWNGTGRPRPPSGRVATPAHMESPYPGRSRQREYHAC